MKLFFEAITDKTSVIRLDGALITMYEISPGEFVLIDSGARVTPFLPEYFVGSNIHIAAVLHTHLHSDHIANDRLLQNRFNTTVYAGAHDLQAMRDPARIPDERGYTTEAYISEVIKSVSHPMVPISEDCGTIEVCGARFEIIQLPGHSFGQLGISTPDGVCCLGDAVISPHRLEQMKLPYHADIGLMLESAKSICSLDYPFFVIAHEDAVPYTAIKDIVSKNILKEESILEKIKSIKKTALLFPVRANDILLALGIYNLDPRRQETVEFSANARIKYLSYSSFGKRHLL